MTSRLELEIIYVDEDLVELRVSASNGPFAGAADVYASHESLAEVATQLAGFPQDTNDEREVTLGTMNAEYAGGGFVLRLKCRDRARHIHAYIALRADPRPSGNEEHATFLLDIDAANLDRFVEGLRSLPLEVGASAELVGAA